MRTSDMKLNNETIGMMKICICSVPYQINYICGVMASAFVLKGVRAAQSLVFCVVLCLSLFIF